MKKWLLLIFSILCCLTLYASGLFNQAVNTQSLNVIGKKQVAPANVPLSKPKLAANLTLSANASGASPSPVNEQGDASTATANSQNNNFTVSNSRANQPNTVLSQEQTMYAEEQIQLLKQALASLSNKIQGLSSAYAKLNVQVQQLQLDFSSSQVKLKPIELGVWQSFGHYVSSFPATMLLAIIILLLLVLLYLILLPRKSLSTTSTSALKTENASDDQDTEQEYDFMGSKEGVPAKIDLARAYVAMQDYQQAKQVLDDVLAKGNNEQRQAAQAILNSIPGEK